MVRRSQRFVDKDVLRGGCVGWGGVEGGRENKGEEEEEEEGGGEEEVVVVVVALAAMRAEDRASGNH